MEEKGWLALTLPAHGEETWALLPEGRGHLTAASPAGNTAAGGCSLPPGLTPRVRDWVAGTSEGVRGTQRHKGLTGYSLALLYL